MATAVATPSTANRPPNPPRPSKRLIVCCDGTWEAGDHATKGDSSYQTNITRICHALADDAVMPDGTKIPQIIYYQSGVGSSSPTGLGRAIAGAIGSGVNENILSAYNFLVNNYTIGDELFFFGFSRGSFTCRSLAGMISQFGILKQEEAGEWFAGIWDRYQGTLEDPKWEKDKHNLVHSVNIKVIGCWDTVGSLGIPESSVTQFFNLNSEHAFHDTELSNKVENAFHALALDEHRGTFSPTLWYIPPEQGNVPPTRRTQLKQCWFAGVHTDVGRGYEDHAPGDIADITFAWMVDQCVNLLAFNREKVPKMLEKGDFKEPSGEGAAKEQAEKERAKRVAKAKNWGLADLHDSMTLIFKLGSSIDRTPGQYVFKARDSARLKTDKSGSSTPSGSGFVTKSKILHDSLPDVKAWHVRLWSTASGVFAGPPEDLSKLDQVWTSEVIHPSVRMRRMQDPTYDPPALKDYKLKYDAARSRWLWIKRWTDDHGIVREKKLQEDRIEDSYFSMLKVGPEMLKFRANEEEPIPPRPASGSWFWN